MSKQNYAPVYRTEFNNPHSAIFVYIASDCETHIMYVITPYIPYTIQMFGSSYQSYHIQLSNEVPISDEN